MSGEAGRGFPELGCRAEVERSGKEGKGEPGTGVEFGRSLGLKCHVVDVIISHDGCSLQRRDQGHTSTEMLQRRVPK